MAFAPCLRMLVVTGYGLLAAVCHAQSFDCSSAPTAIETAIRASPVVAARDTALAASYRQAVADLNGDAVKLNELRAQQRRWVADRNKSCADTCLTMRYRTRLAALNAASASASQIPPASVQLVQLATPPAPKTPPAQGTPAQPVQAASQPISIKNPPRPIFQPRLASDRLPADQDSSTLLTVDTPGHIAIRTQSSSGMALQLIDMIAGPGERMGAAGVSDGRIDALLDKGTYKIRVFGAKGASGEARLTAQAYQELEQPDAALTSLTSVDAELSDLQQRSYWIDIPDSGRADIEAVGRSLQDLRLWRNGTDIAALSPRMSIFELKPGLPMTRAALTGTVEPGRYLVTAYGGQKLVWTNSDAAEPFHIRTGTQMSLAGGIAEGVIGSFGSIRFEAPADLDTFRLTLPQSAQAVLRAGRISDTTPAFQSAAIGKANREPTAMLALAANGKPGVVEVLGYEGQRFQVRGLRFGNRTQFDGAVANLISLDVAGEGGDEIPATAVLMRRDASGKTTIIASDLPHLSPGQAWRRRFNLRGPTSLLFEMKQAGPIEIRSSGIALHADISPILAENAPRVDGQKPNRFDLNAGYYLLSMMPDNNAVGIVDLVFGTPGLTPPVQAAAPARTTISFDIRQAEKATSYEIITNIAPGLLTGPRAVALPADLQARPLALWQPADVSVPPEPLRNQPLSNIPIPVPRPKGAPANNVPRPSPPSRPAPSADLSLEVHVPPGGTITAVDAYNAPVAFTSSNQRTDDKGRTLTLRFPAPSAARSILVSWQPDPAPAQASAAPAPASPLIAGQRQFLDLAEDAQKSYQLDIVEGGLYRIETLGRLQTSLSLGTSFLPGLGQASDNGDGHNALLQTYLRAGTYQINVSAQNSAGHLGVAVTPASLLTAATLVSDGTSRGILAGSRGAVVPIEIVDAGSYQLDLYSLGDDLTARLEDTEGWPLTAPGPLSTFSHDFTPGRYRLVIMPRNVDTRFVARLRPQIEQRQLQGHGPHLLDFNEAQAFQWREPQSKNDARVPDSWTFDLEADADASIDLTEGMIGTLVRNDKDQIARFVATPRFSGKLKAGHYRIDLVSLAHDDRLDYRIALNTKDLQPGEARYVDLPSELAFNVDKDRVISLGTFGRIEVKGVLKDEHGTVLERLAGRGDDWNVALSTRLTAGSYTLSLDRAVASGTGNGQSADNPDDMDADAGDVDAADNDQVDASDIEVQFALPREQSRPALAANGMADVNGASVFTFPLPDGVKDQLLLVAAQSTSDLVLSVEKRDAEGNWKPQAFARGRVPLIAWPQSEKAAQWRASVWTLDGGAAPIRIAARNIGRDMREPGDIALEPLTIDGLGISLNVALAHAPSAGLMDLGATSDLLVGASADRPLTAAASGLFAPQSDRLWLISRTAGHVQVDPVRGNSEIALTLAAGDRAVIPATPSVPGRVRMWRADSAFGQPGLTAGRGMGVSLGSAAALAENQDLHVWNAASDESLQMLLKPIDAAKLDAVQLNGTYGATLPALSVRPLKLTNGVKRLTLDLGAGIAVVSAPSASQVLNVWSGGAPLSRSIATSADEIWLVNLTDDTSSVRISLSPGPGVTLVNDQIKRRFFGTVGSEEIAVDAVNGDVLNVSGGAATFVGTDGRVFRGDRMAVSAPGQLIVDHGAGLVALWLERGGRSPWPKPQPKSITLPQSITLEGEAMAFRLTPAQQMVLDVSTDAPVIVSLDQNGRRDLQLFPTGAEFHRYLAANDATLTLYSTHDGPLSGNLNVSATPVVPANDGIGAPTVVAPGTTALFGFEVKNSGKIGIGLRSDPDLAVGRLLDAKGQVLGEGVNQLRQLEPGYYLLEAHAPSDAPTLIVRPSVVGLSPPPAGPPPEVMNDYLQRAGLKPTGSK